MEVQLKQSHLGSQGEEAPTASLACRSRSFSVLKRCCSALSALRRSWGREKSEGVQGPQPLITPPQRTSGVEMCKLECGHTWVYSPKFQPRVCTEQESVIAPRPKGWHGMRIWGAHLPLLTMRSFRAMSSSSSFLRCSKCTSMSVCSSNRSFSMRFR